MSNISGQILACLKKLVREIGLTYRDYNMDGNHLAILVLDRNGQQFACLEVDGDSLNFRVCPPQYHCERHPLADPDVIDSVMAKVVECGGISGALSTPEIPPIED